MDGMAEWIQNSFQEHRIVWLVGIGILVSMLLGAWIQRKLSKKPKS